MSHRPTTVPLVRRDSRRRLFTVLSCHPIRGRLAALVLALTAGAVTLGAVSRAESLASAYGSTRTAFVARHRIDPGVEVGRDDVERRELPVAVIPDGTNSDPVGRTAIETVHPGEPVLDARLAPEGIQGQVAMIQPAHHGLAIPLDVPTPTLAVGDQVDILGGRTVTTVVRGVTVIDVSETAVTVAVADPDLAAVAQALVDGVVILALAGPG